jgi:hypothetical protein
MELARLINRSLTEAVKNSLRESIARRPVRGTDTQRVVERVVVTQGVTLRNL